MINDDLLSKFDRIQDLPVSEEMLGAYMEGTLSYNECDQIEDIFATNTDFASFFNDVSDYNEASEYLIISDPDLFEISGFPSLVETDGTGYETDDAPSSFGIFQDLGVATNEFDDVDSFINLESTSSFDTESMDLDLFNNTNSDMLDTDNLFGDDQLLQ
ncbi:MAG: hypothetical protein K1W14_06920 [Muribaculaceae bacterium]|jgi:hypothetical protein